MTSKIVITEPWIVFCDTCIFWEDFYLNSSKWIKVKSVIESHPDAKLLITAPLKAEVLKKLDDVKEKDLKVIDKTFSKNLKMKRVLQDELNGLEDKYDKFRDTYFQKFILDVFNNKVIFENNFPQISLEETFDNAININRPFKKEDHKGGYSKASEGVRDFAIWRSLEECIKAKKYRVLFLTINTKDFSNNEGQSLHADFMSRLKKIGYDNSNFFWIQSDSDLDEHLNQIDKGNDIYQNIIVEAKEANISTKSLEGVIFELLDFSRIMPSGTHDPIDINNIEIEHYTPGNLYEDGKGAYLLEGDLEVTYELEFFIERYCGGERLGEDTIDFYISDGNWNDYFDLACSESQSVVLPFICTIEYDHNEEEVTVRDFIVNGTDILTK